ncbi:flagellar hook-basal body complex protein FliE [Rosenbergiella australiborealis]|uniref:Flagellar hook-basal body complex protein FliE n=1 Tax=Rosenbergiella australiborealis TaxID=1544696 RepID=A0ABS5T5D8_9GAMM|nr:flagellar hook-basal body complex protein FliE [Rosenbergiella australiborealis]MBT0727556.1 flagellar hook-basal body complex protein FliE [Rosenbergiella australiborealis]
MDPKISLWANTGSLAPISHSIPAIDMPATTGNESFQSVLSQAIGEVNHLQLEASTQQNAVNAGQSDDLAGAMIASQQANISFTALLQVRNKLSSALDDILNTPL